ncbi:MAG: hypothetical protein LUC92_08155 [Clostridiales bacterium]|nr:hypothetical protein [Clostridiales bacterium]
MKRRVIICIAVIVVLVISGCYLYWRYVYDKQGQYVYPEENNSITSSENSTENNTAAASESYYDKFQTITLEQLKEHYGTWEIIDSDETNLYAPVSKIYTYDDIHHSLTINGDGILIDGQPVTVTSIKSCSIDESLMYFETRADIEMFGFKDNLCEEISINAYSEYEDLIFTFYTDGEKNYYYYSNNFLKMTKTE